MTSGPGSMSSIESQKTAAQKLGRNIELDGTDTVEKRILLNPSQSCPLVLFDATGSPDGDTMLKGPIVQESGQRSDRTRTKNIYSRLPRRTGRGSLRFTSSLSSALFQ